MNTNNSTKLSADQRVDEVINNIGRGEFWDFEKIKQKFIEAMEEYASQQREDEGVTEDKKEVILQMYKGLTALRLEVDGSIVDELIQRFKKVESLLNAGEPMAQKEDQEIEKLAEEEYPDIEGNVAVPLLRVGFIAGYNAATGTK